MSSVRFPVGWASIDFPRLTIVQFQMEWTSVLISVIAAAITTTLATIPPPMINMETLAWNLVSSVSYANDANCPNTTGMEVNLYS